MVTVSFTTDIFGQRKNKRPENNQCNSHSDSTIHGFNYYLISITDAVAPHLNWVNNSKKSKSTCCMEESMHKSEGLPFETLRKRCSITLNLSIGNSKHALYLFISSGEGHGKRSSSPQLRTVLFRLSENAPLILLNRSNVKRFELRISCSSRFEMY